jgi:hypothetical protein
MHASLTLKRGDNTKIFPDRGIISIVQEGVMKRYIYLVD